MKLKESKLNVTKVDKTKNSNLVATSFFLMLANPWSVNPVKPPICVRKLSKKIAVSERLLGKLSLWELKIKPVLQI